MPRPKVCVIGSSNLDMNAYLDRFPEPGETRTGSRFITGFGGKGANQAVMAARRGAEVRFIARIGDDFIGRDMLEHFRSEGIDSTHVRITERASSGVAVITIDSAGQNMIVAIPGANHHLTAADVETARSAIESAQVLVCQMEVPLEANLAGMKIAKQAGVPVIFNPAPAPSSLPDEAFRLATVLCVNETEAAQLSGQSVNSVADAEAAARILLGRGVNEVIVTMGSFGCLLVSPYRFETIRSPAVNAVDTTGAGDAFVGSLAFDLASGCDLALAADRACRVAAISVQHPGAQASYPRTVPFE